jgi:hypothetical protein
MTVELERLHLRFCRLGQLSSHTRPGCLCHLGYLGLLHQGFLSVIDIMARGRVGFPSCIGQSREHWSLESWKQGYAKYWQGFHINTT